MPDFIELPCMSRIVECVVLCVLRGELSGQELYARHAKSLTIPEMHAAGDKIRRVPFVVMVGQQGCIFHLVVG